MLSKGKRAARKLKRAQILLAADAGRSDEEIARAVAVGGSTVYRTKRRFVEGNLERALSEDPRPGADRKLTGKEEALLGDCLCEATGGPRPLDAEPLGRCHRQAHRSPKLVARDRAPTLGRERSQAVAPRDVVHSPGQWRICRPDGGCARPLCRGARSQATGDLLRREPGPAHRRGASTNPGRTRPARTLRLRVPP